MLRGTDRGAVRYLAQAWGDKAKKTVSCNNSLSRCLLLFAIYLLRYPAPFLTRALRKLFAGRQWKEEFSCGYTRYWWLCMRRHSLWSLRLQRLLLGIAFAVIANKQREVRLALGFRAKECGHNSLSSPGVERDSAQKNRAPMSRQSGKWQGKERMQTQGKIERWHQTLNRIFENYYLTRRPASQDRHLRLSLQSSPLSREPGQSHAGRRLLRPQTNHCWNEKGSNEPQSKIAACNTN